MSRKTFSPKSLFDFVSTRNRDYKALLRQIQKVVSVDTPILLIGESGTGKGYMSEAIHRSSNRFSGPFIKIDCQTIPPDLFESELFGHEKGAFTDAYETKIGKMELAKSGTILFDNIDSISIDVQSKLLRVFEEKSFYRLGSQSPVYLDVRYIITAGQDLANMVNQGSFRKDLFYRFNILAFTLPPLRERRNDIPFLAAIFAREFADEYQKKIYGLEKDAHSMLLAHSWKGNIRELRNTIQRAVILCSEDRIRIHHLPVETFSDNFEFIERGVNEKWSLEKLEEMYIRKLLSLNGFNQSRTAVILGISRKTLLEKRKKYGINV